MEFQNQDAAHELCIILSDLNYNGHKTIVMPQSFSRPNFTLVVKLLDWFARILFPNDPDLTVHPESLKCNKYRANDVPEIAHVEYLKRLAKKFYSILGVRLHLLRLYRADSSCCTELLKVAEPILKAAKLFVNDRSKLDESCATQSYRGEVHMEKLRDIVENSSQLSEQGERVAEFERMLADEDRFHGERLAAIGRKLEVSQVAKVLNDSYASLNKTNLELKKQNDELYLDLGRLDEKLVVKEKKISELKSKADDLALLQSPIYLEKLQNLRGEYEAEYECFVSSYRTLTQLKVYLEDDEQQLRDSELETITSRSQVDLFPTRTVEVFEKSWDQIETSDSTDRADLIISDASGGMARPLESLFNEDEISTSEPSRIKGQTQLASSDRLNLRKEGARGHPSLELDALLDEFDVFVGTSSSLPVDGNLSDDDHDHDKDNDGEDDDVEGEEESSEAIEEDDEHEDQIGIGTPGDI